MKLSSLPLRRGYYQLLNEIEVGDYTIPFFDKKAPNPSQTPYIIIQGITPFSGNTKDNFGESTQVTLFVYTSYMGDFGGTELADLITEQVLELVIPEPGKSGVSATGFNVYMAKLVDTKDEKFEHEAKTTFRKRITIEHLIQQL